MTEGNGELSREKVLELVEKLLRLQESPNPNEAALASSKVAELLQRYNLSLSEVVRDSVGPEIIEHELSWDSNVMFSWETRLAGVLCDSMSCRCIYRKGSRHDDLGTFHPTQVLSFVGRKVNAEATSRLFSRLRDLFRVGASQAYLHRDKSYWVDDRHFRNSWLTGAINGVQDELRRQKSTVSKQTSALMVVQEKEIQGFLEEKYEKLGRRESYRSWRPDTKAFNDGYQVGRSSLQEKLDERGR
jgi:hypothetical protein